MIFIIKLKEILGLPKSNYDHILSYIKQNEGAVISKGAYANGRKKVWSYYLKDLQVSTSDSGVGFFSWGYPDPILDQRILPCTYAQCERLYYLLEKKFEKQQLTYNEAL